METGWHTENPWVYRVTGKVSARLAKDGMHIQACIHFHNRSSFWARAARHHFACAFTLIFGIISPVLCFHNDLHRKVVADVSFVRHHSYARHVASCEHVV
jgi:hypothetical protein